MLLRREPHTFNLQCVLRTVRCPFFLRQNRITLNNNKKKRTRKRENAQKSKGGKKTTTKKRKSQLHTPVFFFCLVYIVSRVVCPCAFLPSSCVRAYMHSSSSSSNSPRASQEQKGKRESTRESLALWKNI